MTDNWDSYFCLVDDEDASIVVNLGLASEAPVPDLPYLCYVTIALLSPGEEALSEQEEEQLAEMEDSLVESFHAPDTGRCAGHCLSPSRLDIYFYMGQTENWADNVAAIMERHPSHEWEAGSYEDPDWSLYFDFLLPDKPTFQHILNRRVREELEEHGADLAASHHIEHWAGFPSQESAESFADAVRPLGFAVGAINLFQDTEPADKALASLAMLAEKSDTERLWLVSISRNDAPAETDEITLRLYDMASEHQGTYLGWSCPHVGEETDVS